MIRFQKKVLSSIRFASRAAVLTSWKTAFILLLTMGLLCSCGKGGNGPSGSPSATAQTAAPPATEAPVFEKDAEDHSTFSLLVYMIGSDLESMGGAASADLGEILAAQSSPQLKIAVQTGGAISWENEEAGPGNACRRFLVKDGKLELQDDLGVINMSDAGSLADFIRWGADLCPADRSALILWNHGAGTLMGYGMDENYESVMLEICDLQEALQEAGKHFTFIGFDACLMSTVEVASALEGWADYLICSEETEPANGWNYVNFLSLLAAQPGVEMEKLGKRIVDDFVDDPDSTPYDNSTLAVLDLSKLPALRSAVANVLEAAAEPLQNNYADLSLSRSKARSYGGGMYEQVDILDLLDQLAAYLGNGGAGTGTGQQNSSAILASLTAASDEWRKAASDMTLYTRSMDSRSGGLALYFPYLLPDRYEKVSEWMEQIGYDRNYFEFFDQFLSIVIAEQERADVQPVAANVKQAPWYHPENVDLMEETYIDPSTLQLKEAELFGEQLQYIDLKGEQWKLIDQIENVLYVDTEEYGLIELGCKNLMHTITETGDPYYAFDGLWMELEDRIVPYYEAYYTINVEDSPYSFGMIPAELNGRDISILVCFADRIPEEALRPDGTVDKEAFPGAYIPEVLGYRREPVLPFARRTSVIDISAGLQPPDKGVHPFREGDEIRLYAFRADGSKIYIYEDPILFHEREGITVFDDRPVESFTGGHFSSVYQQIALRDIFNNTYLCEGAEISYEWKALELEPEVNSPGMGPGPEFWDGDTSALYLIDDSDARYLYPADLFEENEDWEWGEPDLVSRDGKFRIYATVMTGTDEYRNLMEEEMLYAIGHDYSLENYQLANGMYGQRLLYHENDGRWFCCQMAVSERMKGGIYGCRLQIWAEEDPDEEMLQAIMYIGNSLQFSH